MKKNLLMTTLFVSLSFLLSSPAQSASPKSLGKFGYWQTYVLHEGKNPVCYMSLTARPPEKKGAQNKRGNVVLMVAHRPAESAFDVVSYSIGAKFKPSSDVTVKADGRKFSLFTKDDTAWSRDSATDQALAQALRKGDNAIILGQMASNDKISDDVSLKGSNMAYKVISKACAAPVGNLSK